MMATEAKILPCGCRRGFSYCAFAQALWNLVSARYEAAKATEEWQAYDEALVAYRRHFEEGPDGK